MSHAERVVSCEDIVRNMSIVSQEDYIFASKYIDSLTGNGF